MTLGQAPGGGQARVAVASAAAGLLVGALGAGGVAWQIAGERDAARAARHEAVAALDSARSAAVAARAEVERVRGAGDRVAVAARQVRQAEALDPGSAPARAAWRAAVDALGEARTVADGPALREALALALVGLGEAELPADPARARASFTAALELAASDGPLRARALVGRVEAGSPGPGEAEAALEAARGALLNRPDAPEGARTLARALLAAAAGDGIDLATRRRRLTEAAERAREVAATGRPPELLATALERLAPLAADEAPALLDEAVRARRALAQRAPGDAGAGRALVRSLVALAAVDARRALSLLDEAARLARQLVARDSASAAARELLVAALEAEGRTRAEAGDHARARVALEQALAAASDEQARDDLTAVRSVVRLQLALAPVLARERDLPAARLALEDAARGARSLLARDPTDVRATGDLVLALLHLATLDQEQGHVDAARAQLEQAAEAARAAPSDAGLARARGLALWRLAGLDLAAGELDRAVAGLEEALATTRGAGVQLDGLAAALDQARRRRELLRGETPATPAEQLQQAYALLSLGDPAAALLRFEAALEDPGVRADVTRGHLYQAARAAAQAGQRARALEWLAEDVRRRRERVVALERAVKTGGLDADGKDAATAERDRLLRHLEHARRAEPAFAGLRGAAEFEGAFE